MVSENKGLCDFLAEMIKIVWFLRSRFFNFAEGTSLGLSYFLGYFSHTFYQRPISGDFFNIKKINISRAFFYFQQSSQLFILRQPLFFIDQVVFIFAAELFFQLFDQTPLIFRAITFYQNLSKSSRHKIRYTF